MLKKERFHIQFPMKETLHRRVSILVFILSLTFYSCRQDNRAGSNSVEVDTLQRIHTVVAIGKVVPAKGWMVLASEFSGIVQEILVKEGEQVKQGQVLIKLGDNDASLSLRQSEIELRSRQADNQSLYQDLRREELKLAELKAIYETSLSLYEKNAETKEKMESDRFSMEQQLRIIAALENKARAEKFKEEEQTVAVEKARRQYNERSVRAVRAGVVSEMDVKLGQTVNVDEELGRLVNLDELIVEAEVDELFADRVQLGQQVTFFSLGNRKLIGTGEILYISPTLMNKSILYETANEGEDRRVRRIKIRPTNVEDMLINTKLECQIKID